MKGSGNGTGSGSSADLPAAVKSFQELHSIAATGVVDDKTLAALNVPLDWRIQQVAINLQRWRWMPDDLGERHFFVNIPYYHLVARESGKPVMDIRVVVGKPGNNTPIFSEDMETVVFSPYWNIPDTIAENETAPAVARDPNYLARQGIEILRVSASGTATLNASEVDWDNPEAVKGLVFRQRPGDGNALGHVKFLFPNPHNVYLHDTPADALFAKPGRAFSHGCIRVEEPEALAKYVLKGYPEWDDEAIFAAMRSGVEKHVKMKTKIPVHIAYFTAWVDENGGLHFQPDIYGYDRDSENYLNDRLYSRAETAILKFLLRKASQIYAANSDRRRGPGGRFAAGSLRARRSTRPASLVRISIHRDWRDRNGCVCDGARCRQLRGSNRRREAP